MVLNKRVSRNKQFDSGLITNINIFRVKSLASDREVVSARLLIVILNEWCIIENMTLEASIYAPFVRL